jgi:hypothetical protein
MVLVLGDFFDINCLMFGFQRLCEIRLVLSIVTESFVWRQGFQEVHVHCVFVVEVFVWFVGCAGFEPCDSIVAIAIDADGLWKVISEKTSAFMS